MVGVDLIGRLSLQISKSDKDVVERCLRDGVVFHSGGGPRCFHALEQRRDGQRVRLDMPHQLPIALVPEASFGDRRLDVLHHTVDTVILATHIDHISVTKPVQ